MVLEGTRQLYLMLTCFEGLYDITLASQLSLHASGYTHGATAFSVLDDALLFLGDGPISIGDERGF